MIFSVRTYARVSENLPELWILGQYETLLAGRVRSETQEGTTVLSKSV